MRAKILILLLFPFLTFSQEEAEAAETGVPEERVEVILGIDQIVELDFSADPRIEVGNQSILNYTFVPTNQQIILKGIRAGTSSMTVRDRAGNIKKRLIVTITATAKSAIVKKLRAHLDSVEGLEIKIVEGDVVIEGMIYVPKDIGKVVAILSGEEFEDVIRLIELAPQTQILVASRMQEEIQNGGHRDVTVRVVNDVFVLEGMVANAQAREDAGRRAQLLIPERLENLAQQFQATQGVAKPVIVNNITVNPPQERPEPVPKLVKITAQFVELTKSYKKAFGFSWRPLLSDQGGQISIGRPTHGDGEPSGGLTTRSSNTLSAVISNLFPKLNSGKSSGHFRLVQSGVVVTEDKKQTQISKTNQTTIITAGEQPISTPISTKFEVSVTPTILEKENIRLANLTVTIGAQQGDPSATINQTQSNTVSTNLIVKSRESAAVGGVVQRSTNTDYNGHGAPDIARQSPDSSGGISAQSLFSFIKSKDYTENKAQFVVFVTPEIIENASKDAQAIRRKFRRRGR